jgi:hypothetical protein
MKKKDDLTMDLFGHDDPDYPLPSARTNDPETSHLAAIDARKSMGPGHRLVLRFLYIAPMTDYELAEATGFQQNSIGKRRGECEKVGFVTVKIGDDGKRLKRPAPSGSLSLVWCLTLKGIMHFEEHRASWEDA